MGWRAKWEYFREIYWQHRKASGAEKGRILDEFCRVCRYNRKYAIRKLGVPPGGKPQRRRRPVYGSEVISILREIWVAAGYPWSVRLKRCFLCRCRGPASASECRRRSSGSFFHKYRFEADLGRCYRPVVQARPNSLQTSSNSLGESTSASGSPSGVTSAGPSNRATQGRSSRLEQ